MYGFARHLFSAMPRMAAMRAQPQKASWVLRIRYGPFVWGRRHQMGKMLRPIYWREWAQVFQMLH